MRESHNREKRHIVETLPGHDGVSFTNDPIYSGKYMELIIIVSTITSFFSHFMIVRGVIANTVSVITASFITLAIVGFQAENQLDITIREILVMVVIALVISLVVGLVFSNHKKCSK